MKLLTDILNEGDYADFREQAAARVRRAARLNRWRHARKWIALAACVAFLPAMLLDKDAPPAVAVSAAKKTAAPVHYLTSRPLKPEQILTSRPISGIVVATDHTKKFPAISDNELLALFPNSPAVLAGNSTRLLFLDPRDSKRFFSSN